MFEVKRSESLKIKIYGEEYSLKKPSVSAVEEYSIDIDKVSAKEQFARAKSLLLKMGLPEKFLTKDSADELEFGHLKPLVQHVTDEMVDAAKKN